MTGGRALELLAARGGQVHVARTVPFVAHVALLLEKAQHAADRRVAGRVRQLLAYLRGGRATPAEEHVHDLPLATAELRVETGHRGSPAGMTGAVPSTRCEYTSTPSTLGQGARERKGRSVPWLGRPRSAAGWTPPLRQDFFLRNSSNQFCTMTSAGGSAVSSSERLIRKSWPSGVTSKPSG